MRWVLILSMVFATLGAWGGPTTEAVSTALKDAVISARIETIFLANGHLSPFNIKAATSNGVVTLSGSVSDEIQKELAGELAQSVEGVEEVVNLLTVVPAPEVERPERSWRQRVDDMTTTASVKSRLLYHKQLRGLKLGVKTFQGVVTLYGVVGSEETRSRVEQLTHDTRGVIDVMNNLTVAPREEMTPIQNVGRQFSDEWVEKRIETSVLLNQHVNVRGLDIEVNDGICILTGTVDSEPQKDLVRSMALNTAGVKDVVNEIRVKPLEIEPDPVDFFQPDEASESDSEHAHRLPASAPEGGETNAAEPVDRPVIQSEPLPAAP
jgi:osmotically-inducible protein OsmY